MALIQPPAPQEESGQVPPEHESNVAGPQPLTRPDCEKAASNWNENANVCD
jgi:hypothetical protein